MADTTSRRSEPGPPDWQPALARFLAAASGAVRVEIDALARLQGGAIQQNFGLTARFSGGSLAGEQRLVVRTDAPTGVAQSLSRLEEFAVLRAAHAAGVSVPEPLFASADGTILGRPFSVMRAVGGSAIGARITRDAALDAALPGIARVLGGELARLHRIRPPRADLDFLAPYESVGPARQIARFRADLDRHPSPLPVLEWALRWLATHIPPAAEPVLCHHDFRTGNYMLEGPLLTGILDWEFAGWGDPVEDIAWFCSKGWRFARLDREAGGIADRAEFYGGYEAEGGQAIDPERVFFWEVLASVRWAVIALQQSDRFIAGGEKNLDAALTGRRASECALALLMLLDPAGAPADVVSAEAAPPPTPPAAGMREAPSGLALLALARGLLIDDILPLVPQVARQELRLVAHAMAIAEREAKAAGGDFAEIGAGVRSLYGSGAGDAASLRRLARDLRLGVFDGSGARDEVARAILWRLTIARLREGNPRFLAANGFA